MHDGVDGRGICGEPVVDGDDIDDPIPPQIGVECHREVDGRRSAGSG